MKAFKIKTYKSSYPYLEINSQKLINSITQKLIN